MLLRIVVPLGRPGTFAVAILVSVFTWNDFGGALVLLQKPETFTAQLALTRFSNLYATDQGLVTEVACSFRSTQHRSIAGLPAMSRTDRPLRSTDDRARSGPKSNEA